MRKFLTTHKWFFVIDIGDGFLAWVHLPELNRDGFPDSRSWYRASSQKNRNRKILEHLEEQKRRLRGGQGASVSNPIPNSSPTVPPSPVTVPGNIIVGKVIKSDQPCNGDPTHDTCPADSFTGETGLRAPLCVRPLVISLSVHLSVRDCLFEAYPLSPWPNQAHTSPTECLQDCAVTLNHVSRSKVKAIAELPAIGPAMPIPNFCGIKQLLSLTPPV
uniref:Uncharacterized protein n=1 Tax=Magallana gigas TaxID=29159 RepID=K1QH63_MAGGI